ncbi:MAG: Dyp-type peroxidase domain-containing protein, partial [Actinomycetota bacterium]
MNQQVTGGISRRRFMAGAGAATVAATVAAGGLGGCRSDRSKGGATSEGQVPFNGSHQAGIATPAQQRLAFSAMDLVSTDRSDLRDLLATWTAAARAMCAGRLVGKGVSNPDAPPDDTGEAMGLQPANLTITIGFGPSLFDGRFGIAARKPAALADLPGLPNENLEPNYTGGDLCIQACSDDPLVCFHAVRNLARLGIGVVEHRWMELGFGRTS